jgi:Flp pilus assembly protein TadD
MIGWLFVLRGANLAKLGYFEEAKACHLQALELTSHPDEVLLNIGYVLRAQRRYAEAGDAFSQANTMSKGCPEATAAIRSMEGLEEVQSRVFRAIDDAASDDGP